MDVCCILYIPINAVRIMLESTCQSVDRTSWSWIFSKAACFAGRTNLAAASALFKLEKSRFAISGANRRSKTSPQLMVISRSTRMNEIQFLPSKLYVFTLVLSDRALWWLYIITHLPRYPNSKACWLPKPAKPPARPQRRKSHRSQVVARAASEAAGPRGRKSDWHSQVGLPHAGDKKNYSNHSCATFCQPVLKPSDSRLQPLCWEKTSK